MDSAHPPDQNTLRKAKAARREALVPPAELTWAEIMGEEPFEGDHWKEEEGEGSSLSLSSGISSFSFSPPHTPVSPLDVGTSPPRARPTIPRDPLYHRSVVEDLRNRQYWREEHRVPVSLPFNSGDPSSLCPALAESLLYDTSKGWIHEGDLVRECLIGLQGHNSLLGADMLSGADSHRLAHLTSASLRSAIGEISALHTRLSRIRGFVLAAHGSLSASAHRRRPCRTLEAFATALDEQLRAFSEFCAQREHTALFAALDDLLYEVATAAPDAVEQASEDTAPLPTRLSKLPTALVARHVLDEVYFAVQSCLSVGDEVTARNLCSVLCTTAEPLWTMCAGWLRNGMSVQSQNWGDEWLYGPHGEFFVERHDLPPASPDFWSAGYTLRSADDDVDADAAAPTLVPELFQQLSNSLLAAGKTVGLLRVMDIADMARPVMDTISGWQPLEDLLRDHMSLSALGDGWMAPHALHDYLAPCFAGVQRGLKLVLLERCNFSRALAAVEGLCLMKRGDVMSQWCDVVFAKYRPSQLDERGAAWSDFHFLNSTFRDVAAHEDWIDSNIVRLSYAGHRAMSAARSVKGHDGLRIEYIAPYPLNYFFSGEAMQTYSTVFTMLVQIRRGQRALEDSFLRITSTGSHELHLLRHYLSWFMSVIVDYISSTLHTLVAELHDRLRTAATFDEMIDVHTQHLLDISTCLLLQRPTRGLHGNIVGILDMCLRFRALVSLLDATPATQPARRRSRATLLRKRSTALLQPDSESEEDEELATSPALWNEEYPTAHRAAILAGLEPLKLREMRTELAAQLLQLRQGVEALAAGTLPTSPKFSSFAFNLQAWDL
ncbi:hypothetical protein AURDEDRAFT_148576 [Auricularia subglabra TFB-10046 SS5]|nr:hypothetical protein AURDEDRAFT_148576 [Auricularia subglabra TFB-10046 SS5]